jgi:DnaJ-class molecular chaperone
VNSTTHYDILRVTRDAPPEVIRAAYKALSQTWHPDKNPSAEAADFMRSLNVAYSVLSDATKRTQYDRTLDTTSAGWAASGLRQQSARPHEARTESAGSTSSRHSEPKSKRAFDVDWDAIVRAQKLQQRKYRVLGRDSVIAISKAVGLLFAVFFITYLVAASHG